MPGQTWPGIFCPCCAPVRVIVSTNVERRTRIRRRHGCIITRVTIRHIIETKSGYVQGALYLCQLMLWRTSKGTLVPEKDSLITAGLSLCLQNEAGYGSLSGEFAGIHASAFMDEIVAEMACTDPRNDAHTPQIYRRGFPELGLFLS